jgi:hypothetical protein
MFVNGFLDCAEEEFVELGGVGAGGFIGEVQNLFGHKVSAQVIEI